MSDDALVDALARKLAEQHGLPDWGRLNEIEVAWWTERARRLHHWLTDPARGDDRLVPAKENPSVAHDRHMRHVELLRQQRDEARAERDASRAEAARTYTNALAEVNRLRAERDALRAEREVVGAVLAERDALAAEVTEWQEWALRIAKVASTVRVAKEGIERAVAGFPALAAENERLRDAAKAAHFHYWHGYRDDPCAGEKEMDGLMNELISDG